MELLTDKEICEWMGWRVYEPCLPWWYKRPNGGFRVPPDFSTEQPWFDYVIPYLKENKRLARIVLDVFGEDYGVIFWAFIEGNEMATFTVSDGIGGKLPDAFRAALTKLVGG